MARPDIIDQGQGSPLVLVPGIQGRCEWMAPAIQALSLRHRVLSFSLNGLPVHDFFARCADRIDAILDHASLSSAPIAGVSFGGLVALHYAARARSRASRLILVSSPPPQWQLDARSRSYARRPRLSLPLFALRGTFRMGPEVLAALPGWGARGGFAVRTVARVLKSPVSPAEMSAWVGAWMATDLAADCRKIIAPTLLITGEPGLDRVVPVSSSLEYLRLIPGSRHEILERTGHMGLLLRPRAFADIVSGFIDPPDPAGPPAGDVSGPAPGLAENTAQEQDNSACP